MENVISCIFREGKKMGHKVGGSYLGILFRRIRVHSLSHPLPGGFQLGSPNPIASPTSRAPRRRPLPPSLSPPGPPPAAPRSTSADAAPILSVSVGAEWGIGLVCCLLMLVVSSPTSLGWIRFFRSVSGGLVAPCQTQAPLRLRQTS